MIPIHNYISCIRVERSLDRRSLDKGHLSSANKLEWVQNPFEFSSRASHCPFFYKIKTLSALFSIEKVSLENNQSDLSVKRSKKSSELCLDLLQSPFQKKVVFIAKLKINFHFARHSIFSKNILKHLIKAPYFWITIELCLSW